MRLIIDTDAGVDDAEAILMALTEPNVTVEAITTVTGNVHVDQVNKNICTILQVAGQNVPVYSGATLPLVEPWLGGAVGVHMNDGLGDWDDRPPCELKLEPEHAANALVRLANENPGALTLIAIGPLTNVALAVRLDPTFPQKIKQFVFMGGTINAVGNTTTPTAEFNIFCDPEAAQIVLDAFPTSTMVSWETTLEHPFTIEMYKELCSKDTPLSKFYLGITDKLVRLFRSLMPVPLYLLPDPLAMAITLYPELILERESRPVTVELNGTHTRGQTVVNYTRYAAEQTPNVDIIKRIDVDGVYAAFQRMLS
jgi:purine nucleosidase